MKVICAWCKKDLGEKEPLSDTKISHGICDDCKEEIKKENEKYHFERRMK